MIGKLGNDSFGTQLRANLESAGVDTASVGVESTSSGIAQIITAGNGENVIVVIPGAMLMSLLITSKTSGRHSQRQHRFNAIGNPA